MLQSHRRASLDVPVGEQRRYSDLGFVLLGEIIEIVSGLPLEQFMNENIFQPLGMKNTTYNPLENKVQKDCSHIGRKSL